MFTFQLISSVCRSERSAPFSTAPLYSLSRTKRGAWRSGKGRRYVAPQSAPPPPRLNFADRSRHLYRNRHVSFAVHFSLYRSAERSERPKLVLLPNILSTSEPQPCRTGSRAPPGAISIPIVSFFFACFPLFIFFVCSVCPIPPTPTASLFFFFQFRNRFV